MDPTARAAALEEEEFVFTGLCKWVARMVGAPEPSHDKGGFDPILAFCHEYAVLRRLHEVAPPSKDCRRDLGAEVADLGTFPTPAPE